MFTPVDTNNPLVKQKCADTAIVNCASLLISVDRSNFVFQINPKSTISSNFQILI